MLPQIKIVLHAEKSMKRYSVSRNTPTAVKQAFQDDLRLLEPEVSFLFFFYQVDRYLFRTSLDYYYDRKLRFRPHSWPSIQQATTINKVQGLPLLLCLSRVKHCAGLCNFQSTLINKISNAVYSLATKENQGQEDQKIVCLKSAYRIFCQDLIFF